MTLLSLHDISYAVRGKTLLKGASLNLQPGEVTVVVGPNGAGKSTLLRLCCGEIAPTSGQILWDGAPMAAIPAWRLAARRAVLPQSSSLGFPFMVAEVVRLGIDTVGRRLPPAARNAIVRDSLAQADVGHLGDRGYQTLSGGERQRVHFARAIAQLAAGRAASDGPMQQILFLDEPTASLDIHHQLLLMAEARRLADAGMCIFAVLHDLSLAAAAADHIVLLRNGELIAHDAPAQAFSAERIRHVFNVDAETLTSRTGEATFAFTLPGGGRRCAPVRGKAR